jgi:hypothetical protein
MRYSKFFGPGVVRALRTSPERIVVVYLSRSVVFASRARTDFSSVARFQVVFRSLGCLDEHLLRHYLCPSSVLGQDFFCVQLLRDFGQSVRSVIFLENFGQFLVSSNKSQNAIHAQLGVVYGTGKRVT